jgi:hypothetical protein
MAKTNKVPRLGRKAKDSKLGTSNRRTAYLYEKGFYETKADFVNVTRVQVNDSTYDPIPGTYDNYDRIERTPYIAMAKAIKCDPILSAPGGYEVRDKTVPDALVAACTRYIEPLIPLLLEHMIDALGMGNFPGEIIWDFVDSDVPGTPSRMMVPIEVMPLDQRKVEVRVLESDTKVFAGLAYGEVKLDPVECIYYRYDPRPRGSYWWYGRSLNENIRNEFGEYELNKELMYRLGKKLSGIAVIAKIIRGMARDAQGNSIDRFQQALDIVRTLAGSDGAVFETVAAGVEDAIANPDKLKIQDIMVEPIKVGDTAPAYETLLKKRVQMQQEMVMGWLTPPRSMMESQHGSRADSEVQTSTVKVQTDRTGIYLHRVINTQLIDPFLELNFGPKWKGAVWRLPSKMTEEQRLANDRMVHAMVQNPVILQALVQARAIDIGKSFKAAGVAISDNASDTIELNIPQPAPAGGTNGNPKRRNGSPTRVAN